MSFFKSWSFSRKLMAVNAGYILPCAILIYFLLHDENRQIEMSQREVLGVQYQAPLRNLFASLSQYKLIALTRIANKDSESATTEKVENARNQVDHYFGDLDEVDHRYAEKLQFTLSALTAKKKEKAAAQALKGEWQTLIQFLDQTESEHSTVAVRERFDNLLDNLRMALRYNGDSSNLNLDPDLDSSHLVDLIVTDLPVALDLMQELLSYISLVRAGEELGDEQKTKIHILTSKLKDDTDHTVYSIQAALSHDRDFQGSSPSLQRELPLALKHLTHATEALTQAVLAFAQNSNQDRAEIFAAGERAMDANLEFWSKTAAELELLLEARIEGFKSTRMFVLIIALLSWLPPVLVASLTMRRLNRAFINSVAKLESEAVQANASSVQLTAASQTVSAASTEQAAAIQETGASMTEIASMVSRSSAQASTSQELSSKVRKQTEEGGRVIERMVYSMEAIQEANSQLQNISNIINDISGKTSIINGIVGKTQLLSFNASIEAARAGQHGRGFAVVAEEVGNLAQTSGVAAEEIRTLIESSRQQVENILETTLARVSEGKAVTELVQAIFAKIAEDISVISTQIEGISEASREQQFGIEQIAKAMSQMDQTTQANNSAAHKASRLSEQLMTQSRKLTTIATAISELVVGINTNSSKTNSLEEGSSNKAGASSRSNEQRSLTKAKTPANSMSASAAADGLMKNLNSPEFEYHSNNASPSSSIDPDDASFKSIV